MFINFGFHKLVMSLLIAKLSNSLHSKGFTSKAKEKFYKILTCTRKAFLLKLYYIG